MKKKTSNTKNKKNPMADIMDRKKEAQKSGGGKNSFEKFKPGKSRNENNSNVGPSWGRRKGN